MGVGRNTYVDLSAFRKHFMSNATLDATDATEIERVIEAASRQVDEHVRRPGGFFATTDTRYFDGNGLSYLPVPDLLAVATVKLDEDGDRAFEVTLAAATDYYRRRALDSEDGADMDALPATVIVLDDVNGQRSSFTCRPRLVEIAGRWGYTEVTEVVEASGTPITGTLADATDLTLAVSAAADLAISQTLLLESEQVYISGGDASPFTVIRGVNGTTAAAHAAVAVNRFKYPAEVREAALIFAGRMWKRRAAGYSSQVAGTPLAGGSDPVAERLLAPFVRWSSLVA